MTTAIIFQLLLILILVIQGIVMYRLSKRVDVLKYKLDGTQLSVDRLNVRVIGDKETVTLPAALPASLLP